MYNRQDRILYLGANMEKSKDIKETHKDFRSKRGAFSRKSYDGRDGSRNRRIKGKRDGLKRKKLEVGAESRRATGA